jgi:hypothetical protein
VGGCCSRKFLASVLKLCKRKQTCIKRKFIQKLDKIVKEQNQTFFIYFNLNCYSSSLIYSFKNETHYSCFNLRKKINKHNRSGVKKNYPPPTRQGWHCGRDSASLRCELMCIFLCAHAHNSQTPRRWNCELGDGY